jgi:hypothetical protein
MLIKNFSTFPHLSFLNRDNEGKEFMSVLAKATYEIKDDRLELAEEQAPLVLSDKYHGAINTSSIWIPSDLVPRKASTDIIFNAIARSPGSVATESWHCGFQLKGGTKEFGTTLRVTGPRAWQPKWRNRGKERNRLKSAERQKAFTQAVLSAPEPVREVPIRYEFAYGGLIAHEASSKPVVEAYENNPIGRGWIDAEHSPTDDLIPAAQIESVRDPIVEPLRQYEPAGLGSIPPAWLPRRPLGGTFDDNWKQNIWPNWPPDYHFAYNNSANPKLIYPGFLDGTERIEFFGFEHQEPRRTIRLPSHEVAGFVRTTNGREGWWPMELDTLFLDVADPDRSEHRVFISWRTSTPPTGIEEFSILLDSKGWLAKRRVAAGKSQNSLVSV